MSFDSQTSNVTIMGIPFEVDKALRKRTMAATFNSMIALTYFLVGCDAWMTDNEQYEESHGWRYTLSHSHKELKVDYEITRPGLESL